MVGVIYFVFKRNKKTQDSSEKPKRTFWNIPFRSEPKAVAIAAAISLCITVWATVDFYRTADTITVDSPSAEVNIEDKQKAEEEAEQKAAEEAAAKEAEQKAAEEAAAKEAEQKAAEEAAAKEAEQKATEEAAIAENIPETETQDTEEYVLNTNSKKFHHSWCSSANRIKPSNRSTCIGRDTAIAMGYTSCGQCNP